MKTAPQRIAFDLVDHSGRPFSDRDLIGRPSLVYFGFLHCRVVCPRSLARIAEVRALLGPAARGVNICYISVDPDRDTPEAMRTYLAADHPGVTGLTGSIDGVESAKQQFRVFARRRADDDDPDGYAMPHTAFIYLLDTQARLIEHFSDVRPAADIADAVRSLIPA